MATVTKYGFTETAKLMTGVSATAFASMALGTSSVADATTLSALVTEVTDSGLARASAVSVTVTQSATASDTCYFDHTWTATGTYNIAECGVLNKSTGGSMLCYGTFSPAVPMSSEDTLRVTWSVQVTQP